MSYVLYNVKVDFENKKLNTNPISMNKHLTRILKFDIFMFILELSLF